MKICFIWEGKMESLGHRIRTLYKEMGPSEKKVADYILDNTYAAADLSIRELAEKSGSTEATIVRFSRRLGFSGFGALRIGMAREISASSSVSSRIEPEDSCFDIFEKRINDIAVALQNTETVLDPAELQKATQSILAAKRIVIFGLGNSASVAQDAAHKLLRLGLNAQACSDNHLQAIIASHLEKQCVAIGISHSGASRDIVDALVLAKGRGATTVCVTNYGNSPITACSDICLFTKAEETHYSILAMSSRIAQLAIFDAIYTYIVVHLEKIAIRAIYDTESALRDKKMY